MVLRLVSVVATTFPYDFCQWLSERDHTVVRFFVVSRFMKNVGEVHVKFSHRFLAYCFNGNDSD